MAFVSAPFVAFMVIVGVAYFAVPLKVRWVVLLVASYVFYFINSEWLILIMFAQTLMTFIIGRKIQKAKDRAKLVPSKSSGVRLKARANRLKQERRRLARIGVLGNLAVLLFLKYWNFFADAGNSLIKRLGIAIPHLDLLLPIGLSFYTLQAISYVVDVQRNKMDADQNLLQFMLFMSYFPQILQGPIPRYRDLAHQLYEGHGFDYRRLCFGAQLILWGFMKKLVFADCLAIPVNQIFANYTDYSGGIVFFAAVGYSLQVYADFSGGVDIARGFSQVVGIELTDNFNQPFFSRSIEEFWRRWHITLGNWMREYVFYTLSLSKPFSKLGKRARKVFGRNIGKKIPPFIATFIVFVCVGIWHGADWKFVVYGVYQGVFIVVGILLEDTLYAGVKKALHISDEAAWWRVFQMVRTFLIVAVGRFLSRASSLPQAISMIKSWLSDWWNLSFLTDGSMLQLGISDKQWILLGLFLALLVGVGIVHERGTCIREVIARRNLVLRWAVYLAALAVVLVFGVYGSGYDAAGFIYQQF